MKDVSGVNAGRTVIASPDFVPATGWSVFLPLYDRLVSIFTPEKVYRRHMLDHCSLKPGQRAIDIGCGTGTFLTAMAIRYPDNHLIGIDIDERVLTLARRKHTTTRNAAEDGVQWLCGSAMALPLADRSVHLVVTSLVFHHLLPDQKRQAFAEIHRVLVSGGRLLLTDFAKPRHGLQRIQYLIVQWIDGWERTICNAHGRLPLLIQEAEFSTVRELLSCNSLLGTIRTYEATK